MESALYFGTLRHRRFRPVVHEFRYDLFMAFLDIDRIPEAMSRSTFSSYNRANWASFHQLDHFGDPRLSLRERLAKDAAEHGVALATARAGNVIGGGDWSDDRLIPDLVRGFLKGEPVRIRRPLAIRPWQHVMEPLHGYIRLAEQLLTHDPKFATAYNFGPSDDDARPVEWIAEKMTGFWGHGAKWVLDPDPGVH